MDFDLSLKSRLASALPSQSYFSIHHISTPPSPCPPLFSAPPYQIPEVTQCESHLLSVSIAHQHELVQVFALEILIYTTNTSTTIFVSKADSTGYLYLLQLPKGTPSPIKIITSQFLEHLIALKRRSDTRLVLSLFARAQNQYLFPGSIENDHKHVLDDRQLIKWWCKIFDSILQKYCTCPPIESQAHARSGHVARAYLIVPGCDAYETRAFFPRPSTNSPLQTPPRWIAADPLKSLGKSASLPERCLIPRFPDDPKARFALDLDDELPEDEPQAEGAPAKAPHSGRWRSVRTLEQFWELMAFRQECAAGRLVGFVWGVFEPVELFGKPFQARVNTAADDREVDVSVVESTPDSIKRTGTSSEEPIPPQTPLVESALQTHEPAADVNIVLEDTNSIAAPSTTITESSALPETGTAPAESNSPSPKSAFRSTSRPLSLLLSASSYTKVDDLLHKLDYADIDLATASTQRFISAAGAAAGLVTELNKASGWGFEVIGEKGVNAENGSLTANSDASVTTVEGSTSEPYAQLKNGGQANPSGGQGVAILGAGLVRKKQKPKKRDVEDADLDGAGHTEFTDTVEKAGVDKETVGGDEGKRTEEKTENPVLIGGVAELGKLDGERTGQETSGVKVLSAGLIRKKPKV